MKLTKRILAAALTVICCFSFSGCKKETGRRRSNNRVVIWTSCSEFAQYIELFNKTHKNDSAILVYKENPALSLPPAKDEPVPDLIVGSWLRSDTTQKNFKTLDYLFDRKNLSSENFYSQLLQAGKVRRRQYLIPVSFNLPAVIFSKDNSALIPDSYTLSLEQIRSTGSSFNTKNKKGNLTKIGFSPLNNPQFLYLTTKLNGVNFREEKGLINWNQEALNNTTDYLKDWTTKENSSAQIEQDFAFKYLFMPYYRQVSSGRTLFAYTTSNELFKTIKKQNYNIDFRWVCQDKQIPAEDSLTMMGIYKKAQNQVGATEFITWFFQSENQRAILERKEALNLETELFGIADGFSSVRDVTEHILPIFYTDLLSNLPPALMISVPQKLPARWESYRSLVVETYLSDSVTAMEASEIPAIPDLEKEWRKKVFD